MKCRLLVGWLAVTTSPMLSSADQLSPADAPTHNDVFVSGQHGYHTYRIPAVIVTTKGTLLAFCEGRRASRSDTGDIDLLLKRSVDGGKTFGKMQVVWDDGLNTCGNPCPVIDEETGHIWLLMTHNPGDTSERRIIAGDGDGTRTVWVTHSADDGRTWAEPAEITKDVKRPDWTWYATGPGVGIQLNVAPHKGRLVIPCDYMGSSEDPDTAGSHVVYSDDHGRTWKLGGVVSDQTNECQVIERSDGSLLLNMRWRRPTKMHRRNIATSADGGLTWSRPRRDETLISPCCQGSLIRYTASNAAEPSIVLFSNPAHTSKRVNMTIRLSHDEGVTWPIARLLWAGPTAYSCLTTLQDGSIGCLYERGDQHPYERITFARFGLPWLTESASVKP